MKRTIFLFNLLLTVQVITVAQQGYPVINNISTADTNSLASRINLFTSKASYIGDFAGNFMGGNKIGTTYLGIANLQIGIETARLGLWNGGEFFIRGAATHGGTPSKELLGDFQVASNIEAGNHIYIHELWYKHSAGFSELTIGLQDLNAEFLVSETGSSFLNSSFGIPSLIADNIPVPIFPLTALGITGKFQFNDDFSLLAAIYDGLPETFEKNQYNVNWNLNRNDGLLLFAEGQFSTSVFELPGIMKAGYYYHSHLKEHNEYTEEMETIFDNNYGVYFLTDQKIWKKNESESLAIFAQAALSPGNINTHNFYIGGGISYTGVFNKFGEDAVGFAFAHAGFSNSEIGNETTLEFFYKTKVTGNLFIQPDFQYIINPAGTDNKLNNALAGFIRFGIDF